MSVEESVKHERDHVFKRCAHTFFEMIFPKRPLDFRAQFLVQWIFPIDAVIQPVQNISADVHFSPAQHLTSACLSNDLQMIRLDFLPQLFQVTHERGSADIHLIGEVVREHRMFGAHQLAEQIIHAVARRIHKVIRLHHLRQHLHKPILLKHTQAIFSARAFDHGTIL